MKPKSSTCTSGVTVSHRGNTRLPRAAYVLPELERQVRRYCWRLIDGPNPGESLWSLIQKFCARNALSGSDALEYLTGQIDSTQASRRRAVDLRIVSSNEILTQLAKITRVDVETIRCSTITAICGSHVSLANLDQFSAGVLRFCPVCVKSGYHAVQNQFWFQTECPIHGELLADTCPKCANAIPYTAPWRFTESYSCPTCKEPLWSDLFSARFTPVKPKCISGNNALENLCADFSRWAKHGILGRNSSFRLCESSGDSPYWAQRHGVRLRRYLNVAAGAGGQNDSEFVHASISIKGSAENQGSRAMSTANLEGIGQRLKAHYKAVARHLRRHLLRGQRRWIESLCLADWRDRNYTDYQQRYRTELATIECFAYLSWRMAWEMYETPGQVIRMRRGRDQNWARNLMSQYLRYFRVAWVQEISADTLLRIDERVFSLVCVETFEKFRRQYRQRKSECGRLEWLDCWLRAGMEPFFLLQMFNPTEGRLHWFKSQPSRNEDDHGDQEPKLIAGAIRTD
jgi:TniQ